MADGLKDDAITSILKKTILESDELLQLIDARAEMKLQEKEFPGCLTRKQLAKMWNVSVPTIDRLTEDELKRNGYIRKKIGVQIRFERVPSHRELYDRIRGNK